MKNTIRLIGLLALAASLALGQTALTKTTFSTAITANADFVTVASATGITAPTTSSQTALYAGQEIMRVISVSGTRIGVLRGIETRRQKHASGAAVYAGPPDGFAATPPAENAPCTVAEQPYRPLIVPATGDFFDCDGTKWLKLAKSGLPLGTAGTGVTAYEYGDGRHRVTKLVFTGVVLGPTVAAANEAYGALLYTFPAGNLIIHAARTSAALTISTSCVADDPDIGLGTTIATGAHATLDAVGTTAEDVLTGQTSVDGLITNVALVQGVGIESASSARKVHLNIADGWAAGACTISGAGTAYVEWSKLD